MLTDINKKNFQSIILLNELINTDKQYKTIENGDNKLLEPLFIELMGKGYVATSGIRYVASDKGKEALTLFMKRYQEYLKVYDIYSFVDLEKGEFAFSKYFDFTTDTAWDSYKIDPRFEDVRISVSIFKKIDPSEIVFMSFINENRFDTSSTGWQMDILSESIWNEIDKICDSAIKPEALGIDAMEDMIKQGTDIMINILKEESKKKELQIENNQEDNEEYEEYETVEYYEPYYDPYYSSPIWYTPLFLW